jgi:glucan-binding YG repeat protein
MMSEPLSKEIIRKAREMVLCGQSKHSVAKDLGVGTTTIYKHTKDIPSGKWPRQLSEETIQQIREEVIKGKSKYQVAKEMNVRFQRVYYYTKDLPNHVYPERGIQGRSLELLKELLQKGYVISTEGNYARLQRLKKYLPMIERAEIKRRSVYYLSDKNKVALQSMIQSKKSKIFSYQELSSMSKVFDVKLSKKEKKSVLSHKQR